MVQMARAMRTTTSAYRVLDVGRWRGPEGDAAVVGPRLGARTLPGRRYPGRIGPATLSIMPFKFNAARRHRIPRARYRVQNWPQYEAGLKRRGDLTLWIDEAAIAGWQAPGGRRPAARPATRIWRSNWC